MYQNTGAANYKVIMQRKDVEVFFDDLQGNTWYVAHVYNAKQL